MAPRKKRIPSKRHNIGSRLLPEPMKTYIARRLYDFWALTLILIGTFLFTAMASYDSGDPSMNTATSAIQGAEFGNVFGSYGAFVSDALMQSFGIAGFIISICFLIWGLKTFRRMDQSGLAPRIALMCLATFFIAIAAARVPSLDVMTTPYMGGAVGALSLNYLGTPIASLFGGWEYTFLAVISGIAGGFCFVKSIKISLRLVWWSIKKTAMALWFAVTTLFQVGKSMIEWVKYHNDTEFDYPAWQDLKDKVTSGAAPEKKKRKRPSSRKPGEPAAPKKPASDIQVVKPKDASQTTEKQGAFTLDTALDWELPPLDYLQKPDAKNAAISPDDAGLRRNAEMLQSVLADFNVSGEIVKIHPGPVVTLYEFEPAPGVKSSRVINLSDDIARSMAALSVRVAVIPGRNVIGIELPNEMRQTVYLRELLDTKEYEKHKAKLPLVLGKDIGGQPIIADLARMPHLLVAGTTGSGKSVAINTMLMSLLYRLSPEQCRLIMIDPKMLELSVYDDIPHLLSPVVTEPGKAMVALKWTVAEMENRYRAMSKLGVRNIEGYNARLAEARKKGETLVRKVQTGYDPDTGKPTFEDQPMDLTSLPYIVVVVDEFADLMLVAGKDVENAIQRLAQMARAAGIHIIMATQRPSVDVITGVVKANFPTRISFHVTSKIDSRTIIGEGGAEQLLGMGDMLFMTPGGQLKRVHGPFVADQEVEDVVTFLKQQGEPSYLEDITNDDESFGDSEVMGALFGDGEKGDGDKVDELYDEAVAIVAKERKASTSFIQRHLQIGYNRAARIIEEMEKQGVIGPANHVGKREVLVSDFSDA